METMVPSKKNKLRFLLLIDSIVILLNLSASYSILPYIVFHQYHRFINALIIVILDVIFICFRTKRFPTLNNEPLLWIYILISFVNLVSAFLTRTGWQYALAYLVLNTLFYLVLNSIYHSYIRRFDKERVFRLLARGYLWLVVICLFSCISLFLLIKIGVNPLVNPVNYDYDLFKSNYEELGAFYYFPFHLSVLNATSIVRIPFFQDYGIICGIYHEPHIVTFMTFPALFLFLYYARSWVKKSLILASFLLIMLLSGSTTNLLAVAGCVIVFLMYKTKTKPFHAFFILLCSGLLFFVINRHVDLSAFMFVSEKMESTSMGYTQVTLNYALSPKTLLGTSFFDESGVTSFGNASGMDVGYIKFLINLVYLGVCFFFLIKLFLSKRRINLAFLLFATYFFFHSTKVVMVSYSLTMLTYVTFIITQLNHYSDRRKNHAVIPGIKE